MENQGETPEMMKTDIQQLKSQMSQILEALNAMQNPGETCTPQQHRVQENQTCPPSSLPSDYTPPPGVDSRKVYVQNVENNAVKEENKLEAATSTCSGETTHPNIVNMVETKQHDVKSIAAPGDVKDEESKLEMLDKRLKAIEGERNFAFSDATGLCLVQDVVIPPKFKLPEFEKYRGNTCPKNHITMFCRKMTAYAHDEKLLIHFFQESLIGIALNWYTLLEPTHIRSWKDLADAFLRQYGYNSDTTPSRLQLQNMAKKEFEAFKEYARRWREIAAQVVPPLPDKEMATMFIDTLESPFYERMVSNVSSSFADLVIIGERIEIGVKTGKITHASAMIASVNESISKPGKRRDRKAQSCPTAQIPLTYPHSGAFPGQNWRTDSNSTSHRTTVQGNVNQDNRLVSFTPIPMTYAALLPSLLQRGLASICPMKPVKPPYPKTYDADARCDYHGGAIGHSTENCWGLKRKVQSLIDSGQLKFE
ncbi:uncharacterized protein LOC114175539 [Vigna unguiculata]|uniref:uncharacterized protein LOC114175539 n=1 Tax=Vigna unguiculata TaxID=3917 RepID=UPI001016AB89|nr:uncharacterized protein LOC114175539 [Vigna unguiculata]